MRVEVTRKVVLELARNHRVRGSTCFPLNSSRIIVPCLDVRKRKIKRTNHFSRNIALSIILSDAVYRISMISLQITEIESQILRSYSTIHRLTIRAFRARARACVPRKSRTDAFRCAFVMVNGD